MYVLHNNGNLTDTVNLCKYFMLSHNEHLALKLKIRIGLLYQNRACFSLNNKIRSTLDYDHILYAHAATQDPQTRYLKSNLTLDITDGYGCVWSEVCTCNHTQH